MIPLRLKIVYTLFVCALVPVYWRQYGPANFLWFSDIALLALVPALWLENALLVSMMAISVVFFEALWNADFFFQLLDRQVIDWFERLHVRSQDSACSSAGCHVSTLSSRCCFSGHFTGSATISALLSGRQLSRWWSCHSVIW